MVSHHRLVAIQRQRNDASSKLSITTVKFSLRNVHGRCWRKPVSCHMRPGWAQISNCVQVCLFVAVEHDWCSRQSTRHQEQSDHNWHGGISGKMNDVAGSFAKFFLHRPAFPQQLIPSKQAGRQCEPAQAGKQNANREFECHLVTLIFAVQVKKSTWQFPGQKDLERDEDLSGFTAREPFQGSLPSA